MKAFLEHINSQNSESLRSELQELYKSFEVVRNYYQIKFSGLKLNEQLLAAYQAQVTKAIYPNKHMEGGLDTEKVDRIVQQLKSPSTMRYYIEVCLFATETCTDIANEYGGDFGEDFYIYFEELFDDVIQAIAKEELEGDYRIRLQEIANAACDGYGHRDQLQETFAEYFDE